MAVGGVSAELIGPISGHDYSELSKLWHYINICIALLVPGTTVLGGWPGLPYGQLGQCNTDLLCEGCCERGAVWWVL
jgi:hypothetical protein